MPGVIIFMGGGWRKKQSMKLLSIVVPVFREEKNIRLFYERLENAARGVEGYEWEFIFVNDGSDDGSFDALKGLAALDKRVKVLDLSRNFGKEIALSAGVEAASGAAVITIDCDMQHPPELIPSMVDRWESGVEIVATIRKTINGRPLMRNIGSRLFYWLMSRISSVEMVSQTTDFRLIDKKVADIFKRITEKNRMYRGILDWMGFRKEYIEFDADARLEGAPGYSYRKLFSLAINSIMSFSFFPLRIAGYLGILITLVSGLLLCVIFASLVLKWHYFSPLSFVVVANTLFMGIVLICLGLIALYIGGIHNEVVNRPLYIVKARLNLD